MLSVSTLVVNIKIFNQPMHAMLQTLPYTYICISELGPIKIEQIIISPSIKQQFINQNSEKRITITHREAVGLMMRGVVRKSASPPGGCKMTHGASTVDMGDRRRKFRTTARLRVYIVHITYKYTLHTDEIQENKTAF